jgi:hypothetical protein
MRLRAIRRQSRRRIVTLSPSKSAAEMGAQVTQQLGAFASTGLPRFDHKSVSEYQRWVEPDCVPSATVSGQRGRRQAQGAFGFEFSSVKSFFSATTELAPINGDSESARARMKLDATEVDQSSAHPRIPGHRVPP